MRKTNLHLPQLFCDLSQACCDAPNVRRGGAMIVNQLIDGLRDGGILLLLLMPFVIPGIQLLLDPAKSRGHCLKKPNMEMLNALQSVNAGLLVDLHHLHSCPQRGWGRECALPRCMWYRVRD